MCLDPATVAQPSRERSSGISLKSIGQTKCFHLSDSLSEVLIDAGNELVMGKCFQEVFQGPIQRSSGTAPKSSSKLHLTRGPSVQINQAASVPVTVLQMVPMVEDLGSQIQLALETI